MRFFTWFLAFVLVVVAKILWKFDCKAYMEIISSCGQVVLLFFPISLFIITFYIEYNVRIRCGGRQTEKFLRKIKLENLGLDLILGRA